MTNTPDWENQFQDRFVRVDHGPDGDDHDCEPDTWNDRFPEDYADQIDAIKDFITSLLSSQRSSLIARIEGLRKDNIKTMDEFLESSTQTFHDAGFNKALDEAISLIRENE